MQYWILWSHQVTKSESTWWLDVTHKISTQSVKLYGIHFKRSAITAILVIVLEASIKTPKETLFCKQAGLYILHTKLGLVVRGHLEPLCMFIITSKTNFMFFKQHLWLFTGWLRQYLVRDSTVVTGWVGVYVNILPFEEWLKISSKTLLVMWRRAIK